MEDDRFDSIARNIARTTNRRAVMRGAAGGGVLSALSLLFSRKTFAASATKHVTCAWDIEAHGSVGPNQSKNWNGKLTVTINPDGGIDKGEYVLVDASWTPLVAASGKPIAFDVVGSSHLRSIDFRTEHDGCVELDFTGVNRFHVRDCQGPMSGSFHGPELVDLGGWRTRETTICQACRGMTCPPGQHLDSVGCSCGPQCPEGYQDCGDAVCVPTSCPAGSHYDPKQCTCGCEPKTCQPDEVWCPVVCKCLPPTPCLELKCPPGYVHELVDEGVCICVEERCKKPPKCKSDEIMIFTGETCVCVPKEGCRKKTCDTGSTWDPKTCSCEPVCVQTECPEGEVWNADVCKCGCVRLECPAGTFWDDATCKCQPACVETDCPAGSTWSTTACSCVPSGCQPVQCANQNFVIDEKTCQCVCPANFACSPPYVPNPNTCACECAEQICSGNFKWNPDACACYCPQITCARGTTLNTESCQCDQIPCPPQKCSTNYVWSPQTCSCVCGLTGCDSGYAFDPSQCFCNPENPCATALPCAKGTIQDPKTCQCACPDGSPICGAGCTTSVSTSNCGACGVSCEFGCQNGQCVPG